MSNKMPETHSHVTATTMPTKAMKLAVLGASGNSGVQVVRQALEQGHKVRAIVRNPEKMRGLVNHKNLTIVKVDDIMKRENLEPHFKDQDAVVSCLGLPIPRIQIPFTKVTFLHESMRAIAPAMRQAKVNRLIAMSSWFLDTSSPDIPTYLRWVSIPFVFGKLIDDHYEMEKYVERECPDINYTLVRLPALIDEDVSEKPVKVVDDKAMYVPDTMLISRADTARFMLSCLGTERWDKKCPAVATH